MDIEGTFLRIERGQLSQEEMATLVAVLLTRRRPARGQPTVCGPRWSRQSAVNAPAGSWLRSGSAQALPFVRVA